MYIIYILYIYMTRNGALISLIPATKATPQESNSPGRKFLTVLQRFLRELIQNNSIYMYVCTYI